MLARRAATQSDLAAFTFLGENGPESLTCGELDRRARAVAAWLERRVARGEPVLLVYPAGLDFLPAFFGCLAPCPSRFPIRRFVPLRKRLFQ